MKSIQDRNTEPELPVDKHFTKITTISQTSTLSLFNVIVLRAFDSTVSLVYLQVCSPHLLHTVSWGPFGGDRGGNGGPMLLVWMWKPIIVSVIEEEVICLLIFYIISVFQSAVWHHFTCFMMLFQGHVTCQNLPGYCKSNASA